MGWYSVSCHVLTRETKSGPILESDYTNTHTKAGIRRAATKSKTRRSKQQINHSPPRLAYLLSTHLNPPPRTATTGTALLSADKRGSTSLLAVSPNTHTTHTPNTRNTHTTHTQQHITTKKCTTQLTATQTSQKCADRLSATSAKLSQAKLS